jgi:mevalonate kinase
MNRSVVGTAPGKVILFGEHAVVYGEPAIAAPVVEVQAMATVEPALPGSGLTLCAADLERVMKLADAAADDPLAVMARLTLAHLDVSPPDATVTIRSTIPIASGLGSGTAVSTAIVRALAAYVGRDLEPAAVSELVYEVEKLHHGTPSGIDNVVVAYGMPVFFVKGEPIEVVGVGTALHLLIADTGVASPTKFAVVDVRRGWERNALRYERLFYQIGVVVREARALIEAGGSSARLGELMDLNHALLRELSVSSAELERLVTLARAAGALGAKLSGAGRGGNAIVLAAPGDEARISDVLYRGGAVRVITTEVSASDPGGGL